MHQSASMHELLGKPGSHTHIVQVYQDAGVLAEAVAIYAESGLRHGEAAILVVRREHRAAYDAALARMGCPVEAAIAEGRLVFRDAAETLASFTREGMPEWQLFQKVIGGLIGHVRSRFPALRAYGEMVDILWQQGRENAAIVLEGFWGELIKLQGFPLFCAYRMDNLDPQAYNSLKRICGCHTDLIPARDYAALDQAVSDASREVLGEPLSRILLREAAEIPPATRMPAGQSTLLWLSEHMPCTAEKVLDRARARRETR
jgi:hypothetical protein